MASLHLDYVQSIKKNWSPSTVFYLMNTEINEHTLIKGTYPSIEMKFIIKVRENLDGRMRSNFNSFCPFGLFS